MRLAAFLLNAVLVVAWVMVAYHSFMLHREVRTLRKQREILKSLLRSVRKP